MTDTTFLSGITSVRFYAVTGGKTKDGTLFEFTNGKCTCMYLDGEEELEQLKARGLL